MSEAENAEFSVLSYFCVFSEWKQTNSLKVSATVDYAAVCVLGEKSLLALDTHSSERSSEK